MTDQPPPAGPLPARSPEDDDDVPDRSLVGTEPEGAPEPEPEPLVGDEPAGAPADTPPEAASDAAPVGPATTDAASPPATQAGTRRLPWKPFVAIALVFVLLGVGLFFLLKKDGGDDGLVKHEDEETGFTIEYPEEWSSLRPAAGDERLLVSAGGLNYLRIRVLPVDPDVDPRADIEKGLAEADPPLDVHQSEKVSINGTDGYYYVYSFTDDTTGTVGVHAHYFLIRGEKMYVLVFQAMPTAEFARLASTYAEVATSFKSTSDKPAPTPTTDAGSTDTTGPATNDSTTTTAPATTPTS